MNKFKEENFEKEKMSPTAGLAEREVNEANSIDDLFLDTHPSPRSNEFQPASFTPDLMHLMQFMADAGRATTIPQLEIMYEHALNTIFNVDDASVRIFTSQEEADRYEQKNDPSQIFRKDIVGNPHGEIYNMIAIDCRKRDSAVAMSGKNSAYGIFLESMVSNVENKLKYWIDKKTGIFSEVYLEDNIAERRMSAEESKKKGYGIIYFDIDNFREYNKKISHEEGDNVLKYFSDSIRSNTRAEDIGVRAGGSADEFLVYAFGVSEQDLKEMAGRIMSDLKKYSVPDHPDMKITASVGISHSYEATGLTELEELRSLADKRSGIAKLSGKDRIVGAEYDSLQDVAQPIPDYETQGYLNQNITA